MAKGKTRTEVRNPHELKAKIKVLIGYANVMILDLTTKGCKVSTSGMELAVGQKLILRLADMSGILATIRWVSQPHAGIEFDNALRPSEFEALKSMSASNVKDLSIDIVE